MIFVHGTLLPDSQLPQVLAGLEGEINAARAGEPLTPETVIGACARLLERLDAGELEPLLARYATPQLLEALARYRPLLRRESLEYKLELETGGLLRTDGARPFGRTMALPLGTLLHITAGNLDGLPAFSAVEGLLTGNVNLVKLPSGDSGLSLALFQLLTEEEPRLAPFLYAFAFPSKDTDTLQTLAALADGVVTWGGDEAVCAMRSMAPPGCKLIEWGHRLSFAYVAKGAVQDDLAALAEHIVSTGGLLCSSCQVIFLDTRQEKLAVDFCKVFLPLLEEAARRRHKSPGQAGQAALYAHETYLEHITDRAGTGERFFRGRGCSITLRPDQELELSPLHGNVLVKRLPRGELIPVLRRQKGRLQTAGLICPPAEREELTGLLARAGLTRITTAGHMSDPFLGENHDGEYPLRRYLRAVDIEGL